MNKRHWTMHVCNCRVYQYLILYNMNEPTITRGSREKCGSSFPLGLTRFIMFVLVDTSCWLR